MNLRCFYVIIHRVLTKASLVFKASNIYEMENFLLSKSSTDDFVFSANKRGVPDGILSVDDVRRDIAIFARLLIHVYVGWPVHDEITKMRILKHLINVYNDAHEISAGEFFKLLKPVVADIPDNHISIRFGTIRFGTKYKKPYKNVGKNIAGNKIVRGEMRDGGVAAIGFSAMIKSDEFKNAIVDFAKNILPKSNALIMDLRGNTGGNSWYLRNICVAHGLTVCRQSMSVQIVMPKNFYRLYIQRHRGQNCLSPKNWLCGKRAKTIRPI